ncbi:MAG: S1C family serine protease [Candidatus Paceibacterota bacterium]
MEDLNKNQIILLALFVSFITSIATGIVTVTLMDQAPASVSQTINRVVERTVERVVPGETSTVVKEVPVIVTEEELIVKAVNTSSPAIFRLARELADQSEVIGSVVYVDARGYFATARSLLAEADPASVYFAVDEDDTRFRLTEVGRGSQAILFRVIDDRREEFSREHAQTKPLAINVSDLNIGKTVIGIGATADGNHTVSVSILSALSGPATATSTVMTTNASSLDNTGGALLGIQSEMLGINTSVGRTISAREVKSLLDAIK